MTLAPLSTEIGLLSSPKGDAAAAITKPLYRRARLGVAQLTETAHKGGNRPACGLTE